MFSRAWTRVLESFPYCLSSAPCLLFPCAHSPLYSTTRTHAIHVFFGVLPTSYYRHIPSLCLVFPFFFLYCFHSSSSPQYGSTCSIKAGVRFNTPTGRGTTILSVCFFFLLLLPSSSSLVITCAFLFIVHDYHSNNIYRCFVLLVLRNSLVHGRLENSSFPIIFHFVIHASVVHSPLLHMVG
jgi:hypothetical protein